MSDHDRRDRRRVGQQCPQEVDSQDLEGEAETVGVVAALSDQPLVSVIDLASQCRSRATVYRYLAVANEPTPAP